MRERTGIAALRRIVGGVVEAVRPLDEHGTRHAHGGIDPERVIASPQVAALGEPGQGFSVRGRGGEMPRLAQQFVGERRREVRSALQELRAAAGCLVLADHVEIDRCERPARPTGIASRPRVGSAQLRHPERADRSPGDRQLSRPRRRCKGAHRLERGRRTRRVVVRPGPRMAQVPGEEHFRVQGSGQARTHQSHVGREAPRHQVQLDGELLPCRQPREQPLAPARTHDDAPSPRLVSRPPERRVGERVHVVFARPHRRKQAAPEGETMPAAPRSRTAVR